MKKKVTKNFFLYAFSIIIPKQLSINATINNTKKNFFFVRHITESLLLRKGSKLADAAVSMGKLKLETCSWARQTTSNRLDVGVGGDQNCILDRCMQLKKPAKSVSGTPNIKFRSLCEKHKRYLSMLFFFFLWPLLNS